MFKDNLPFAGCGALPVVELATAGPTTQPAYRAACVLTQVPTLHPTPNTQNLTLYTRFHAACLPR